MARAQSHGNASRLDWTSNKASSTAVVANLPKFDVEDEEGNMAISLLTRRLWDAWSEGTNNKSYRGTWQNFCCGVLPGHLQSLTFPAMRQLWPHYGFTGE